MKGNIEERACELAVYMIENRTTVREAAKKFGVSKSTVHTVVYIRVAGTMSLNSPRNPCAAIESGLPNLGSPLSRVHMKMNYLSSNAAKAL